METVLRHQLFPKFQKEKETFLRRKFLFPNFFLLQKYNFVWLRHWFTKKSYSLRRTANFRTVQKNFQGFEGLSLSPHSQNATKTELNCKKKNCSVDWGRIVSPHVRKQRRNTGLCTTLASYRTGASSWRKNSAISVLDNWALHLMEKLFHLRNNSALLGWQIKSWQFKVPKLVQLCSEARMYLPDKLLGDGIAV